MTIGERLRTLRKEAGLTQKELGEKLGVSASMVGQYETNIRKPKLETLKKIATVLDISILELVDLSSISPSLNSMLPLIETLEDIQNKPTASDGNIYLSAEERDRIKEIATLIEKIPSELENSSILEKMIEETSFALLKKLNFQGKLKAFELLDDLSKNPDYKAKQ